MRGEGKASRKFMILSLLTLQVIGKVKFQNQFPNLINFLLQSKKKLRNLHVYIKFRHRYVHAGRQGARHTQKYADTQIDKLMDKLKNRPTDGRKDRLTD